ncbi:hypothetical protein QYE76_025783 [Lolium multiflorum]|uniref:Retrotransposon Copia-like N-terminal domain-containing protein n=1 Tax=Lolium multiflorum TaxID=4521 RepID=A0AAD8RGC2_LOLMU|nr:hypothetical protein QYE76_025783 [Lolium multiflorum]
MASSSTSSGTTTIGAPPAMKLTRENFLYWQTQVLPTLRGARVMGLLEGTDAAPSETLEVEDENKKKISVSNPAYDTWVTKDQQVVSFLVNSLSEDVLPHVFGLHHAVDVWRALHNMYSTQSKSRVSTLRGALTNTKKLDMTAQQYITKMKGFASELAAAGKTVDDDELKDYILNGLDGSFNSLVAAINAVPSTSLNDMCSQLLSYEPHQNSEETAANNTSNNATDQSNNTAENASTSSDPEADSGQKSPLDHVLPDSPAPGSTDRAASGPHQSAGAPSRLETSSAPASASASQSSAATSLRSPSTAEPGRVSLPVFFC